VTARPTARWRAEIQEEAAALAAGTLSPDDAAAADLWSEYLLTHTDIVLDAFEIAVQRLTSPSDDQIMAAVKEVVVGLNAVSAELDDRGEMPYETDEREELCAYIDETLEEAGVDLDALTERLGIGRNEITDEWREW
jgi:nucleotide-binding universal stress UspA family protein